MTSPHWLVISAGPVRAGGRVRWRPVRAGRCAQAREPGQCHRPHRGGRADDPGRAGGHEGENPGHRPARQERPGAQGSPDHRDWPQDDTPSGCTGASRKISWSICPEPVLIWSRSGLPVRGTSGSPSPRWRYLRHVNRRLIWGGGPSSRRIVRLMIALSARMTAWPPRSS
jgi:hypothetical protein